MELRVCSSDKPCGIFRRKVGPVSRLHIALGDMNLGDRRSFGNGNNLKFSHDRTRSRGRARGSRNNVPYHQLHTFRRPELRPPFRYAAPSATYFTLKVVRGPAGVRWVALLEAVVLGPVLEFALDADTPLWRCHGQSLPVKGTDAAGTAPSVFAAAAAGSRLA